MEKAQEDKSKTNSVFIVYILGFIYALHSALPAYINSSFLNNFASENWVGLIYATGSIFTILTFIFIPKYLRKYGNYKVVVWFAILEIVSLIGLTFLNNVALLISLFILSYISVSITNFCLDIFLENLTLNRDTGKVRGFFMTFSNLAWLISPLFSGLILSGGVAYWQIYGVSAILSIPVILLLKSNLKTFKDPTYKNIEVLSSIKHVWSNKNIYRILMASTLLQFFYAWMIIYTPIYLHGYIGLGWDQIGIIFFIMLIPFVLTEIPLGRLADKKWGEKEILSIGFIIIAVSTAIMSFFTGKDLWVWALILLATRVGASMVEIMTETYFFKKVNSGNIDLISFFRATRPIAYVVSPLIASVFLYYFDARYLFLVLGVIMFFGLRYSLSIRDTK